MTAKELLLGCLFMTTLFLLAILSYQDKTRSTKNPSISNGVSAVSCSSKKPNNNVTNKVNYL